MFWYFYEIKMLFLRWGLAPRERERESKWERKTVCISSMCFCFFYILCYFFITYWEQSVTVKITLWRVVFTWKDIKEELLKDRQNYNQLTCSKKISRLRQRKNFCFWFHSVKEKKICRFWWYFTAVAIATNFLNFN